MPSQNEIANLLQEAITCHQQGEIDQAESLYRRVIKVKPRQPDSLHLLGVIAHQRGNHEQAIKLIRRALTYKTSDATFYNNLGEAYRALEDFDNAIECYKKAIHLNADYQAAWNNLGAAYYGSAKTEDSIHACSEAIRLNPKDYQAHLNFGNALLQAGKKDAAENSFLEALKINPEYYQAHFNLGNYYKECGRLKDAEVSYLEVLRIKPDLAEAHNSLGNVYENQNKLKAAQSSLANALKLKPEYLEALNNRGRVYEKLGQTSRAIKSYKQGLRLEQDRISILNNLAGAYKEEGRIDESIRLFQKIVTLEPENTDAYSNLLLVSHYSTDLDCETIFTEHREWAEKIIRSHSSTCSFNNTNDSSKRIKVGYVSPDFRGHSVAFFLEPILANHEKDEVEIFCYANVIHPDETTERLQRLAHHWTSIVGLSDDEVSSRIHNDEIDILVDLAGHTGKNRLPIFARKPAPVQVSFLGYPNTTGLPMIDYRLTDANADPPGSTEKWHTEKLVRLEPSAWCYRPMGEPPLVSKLPAIEKDYLTFGSFNAFAKLNEIVLNLWGKLLSEFDHSRLFLKTRCLADPALRERVIKKFQTYGISEERIQLSAHKSSYDSHLECYHEIDIALDPFPYNGTTTTCEALMMGVPVITLEGEAHRSRVGVSLLNQVGLEHLIAKTPEEYLQIAHALASDLNALEELRKNLRSRMQESSLMDEVGFTKGLENAYRKMWRIWCGME